MAATRRTVIDRADRGLSDGTLRSALLGSTEVEVVDALGREHTNR